MTAIHPPPETLKDTRPHHTRTNDAATDFSRHRNAPRAWQKRLVQPDIERHVVLSSTRCIITLVSLTLLVTDIPRTGLGVRSLQDYYPIPLMPSTAVRFGPFNYPVIHVWRVDNSSESNTEDDRYAGHDGVSPVTATRVWPYQYDTTSVGLRGAAELLNVTEFPSFLFHKHDREHSPNTADSTITLGSTFTMLDAFITAAYTQLASNSSDNSPRPLRYAVKHNYVDRIHDFVVSFISKRPVWSIHSLHLPTLDNSTSPIACSNGNARRRSKPEFCSHIGIWECVNPQNESLPTVRLWDHMNLRFQYLQHRYPRLLLDMAVISTQRLCSTSGAMRSTFYNFNDVEVVVLTRGRRCEASNTACTTVFVDDYRYERGFVQTNVVDWFGIIGMLRGSAQAYAWVRLVLLVCGAYEAAGSSTTRSRLVQTVRIIFKIPFQVIVYSSLVPISGYALALFLDSNFMDIFLDSCWASLDGAINFRAVPFFQSTAVQMRNVWVLALVASLTALAVKKTLGRGRTGIPGVRGLVISFTSMLTIVGPYKNGAFRDTSVMSVFRVSDTGPKTDIIRSNASPFVNTSSYIFDDSATMLLFCVCTVSALVVVTKLAAYFAPQHSWLSLHSQEVVLGSTPIVPCGASALWPMTVPCIRFLATPQSAAQLGPRASAIPALFPNILNSSGKVSPVASSLPASSLQRSVVQLTNVAMMTDPLNFLLLRVVGIPLFLYSQRRVCLILPYAPDEVETRTGLRNLQLLDTASSRDLPLATLLQCG